MINRRNYKNFCVLLALTSISCSDSEGWMSSIPLSNEKISFTASLQEGWSGGQGSGDKSRAVKPDFPGLAREQKVLTTDEAFSKPLYLHPIETVNKTQKNQGPTTRGTMNNDPVVGNFRVSANYIKNEGSKKSEEQSLFQDSEAKKEGSNNNWFVADNKTWPLDGSVSFYAYAPYNYNNVSSLQWKGDDKVTQNKTIHYKVPEEVVDQPDFIVAKSEGNSFTSSSANTPVDLHFSHALTAITFSVSDDMEKGVINSIKIEGVKGEEDYKLSDNKWDNKWDLSNSTAAGSYTVSFDGDEGKVEGKRALTGVANDNKVLMMIPQDLGDGAKVTINFTPTGKSAVDLTFDLKGTKWVAGNHVTYLLSTTKIINLNMGSVTYPKWQTADGSSFTSKKLKDSYANGDELGMYIVDKNHKVVKANVQLKTTDGKNWNFSSSQKFNGSLSYDYFLYYPYQADGLAGAPKVGEAVSVNSGTNQISASDFFSGAITEWGKSLKTDQGDDGKFNSCDLQIGKGELAESSSTVAFPTMTHAMGLAHVKLGKRSLSSGVTYISNNDFGTVEPYTWGGKIAYASSEVDGRKLFPLAKYDYACIVSPDISTEFNTASGVKNAWEKALTFTPSTNKVQMKEALVADTGSGSIEHYDIQLGDIFFNDGSITHNLKDVEKSEDHFPVGIVVYLAENNNGNDKWAETNTKIGEYTVGGHGLVMCLKTIGSTGPTNFGNEYAWYSGDYTDTNIVNVQSKSDILKSKNQSNGSGYTNTNYLIGLGSSAAAATAAYQANNYNKTLPANSSKCTGWFLPSAGQYYAALSQCGGMSSDWRFNTYINVTTKINDMLKKVSDSNYTVFFPQGRYTWEWTSSGYTSDSAVSLKLGVVGSKGSGSVRFGHDDKSTTTPVRPFLAF